MTWKQIKRTLPAILAGIAVLAVLIIAYQSGLS